MLPAGIEKYHRMLEAGVLHQDDRGEIIDTRPLSRWRHVRCVDRLTMLLAGFAANKGYEVSVQSPVRLGPRGGLPAPDDVALIMEMPETSLSYDRSVKPPLYARAEVTEVWSVDLQAGGIGVYPDPAASGYRASHAAGPGERVRSETAGDLSLPVDGVLA